MLSSSPWSLWTIGQPNMLSFSWLSSGLMLYETGPCYLGGAMVIVTDDLAWPNKNTAMMASSRTLLDVEIWLFRNLHAHSFQSRPASFSPLPQPHTHTHTHTLIFDKYTYVYVCVWYIRKHHNWKSYLIKNPTYVKSFYCCFIFLITSITLYCIARVFLFSSFFTRWTHIWTCKQATLSQKKFTQCKAHMQKT